MVIPHSRSTTRSSARLKAAIAMEPWKRCGVICEQRAKGFLDPPADKRLIPIFRCALRTSGGMGRYDVRPSQQRPPHLSPCQLQLLLPPVLLANDNVLYH